MLRRRRTNPTSKNPELILITVLSLSLVSGVTSLITGILPQLQQAFPDVSATLIEWLVTCANLSALVTLLLNAKLTQRFGNRRVIISGLLLSALAGSWPFFSQGFWEIMLSRIILGFGVGLFSPHAISLIAQLYQGDLRARLLGYQTGLSALGNALFLLGASLLVAQNWQQIFLLYLVLVINALLAIYWLPAVTPAAKTATRQATANPPLPRSKWALLGLTFLTYLLIWGVQLKLPTLFADRHWGNAKLINLTLALMNLGGLLAGLTFGPVHRRLQRRTLTLGYVGAFLTVVGLLFAPNASVAVIMAVGFNYIYSYTGPYLVLHGQMGLDQQQIHQMSSWLTITTIISAFFAPLVWNLLGQLGPGKTTENALAWVSGCLLIIVIGTWSTLKNTN
ncbi:MFS transporter [Lapidilactobacillus wuchangensis]|uniref:MFS transporter n=1 Tax=Lapidilactobacillus wuchangensis TaxID=2486001 RepID=UPI001CDD8EE1|nr:MFS transporter [Lapidilactobacillus wuchangensis]